MLSAGIQSSFSSNWKPALVTSKRAHSSSEIRNVTTDVTSAALLQLRSTASLGPLTTRQNNAPTSGRNVTRERIGQLDIGPLPHHHDEVRHEGRNAQQHHERILIEETALEAAEHTRDIQRAGRDIVRAESVDDRAVALLPEQTADHQRRLHEHRVIE